MTDADKKIVAHVDFDLSGEVVSPEEIQLMQSFLADLIGEVLRTSDLTEE